MKIISMALILVGLIGIFVIYTGNSGQAPQPVVAEVKNEAPPPPVIPQETITVAVAKVDLSSKTLLTADDFQIESIKVPATSSEKGLFGLKKGPAIIGWAVNSPIAKDSYIPVSALVEPGSSEYIDLFKQPGYLVYAFPLSKTDGYLFDNLKAGDNVDIYLSYDRNIRSGSDEIVSPGSKNDITDVRLKPVMSGKRVLSIRPGSQRAVATKAGSSPDGGYADVNDYVIVELTDNEMKIIKVLEGKSKFVLFPSLPEGYEQNGDTPLIGQEMQWPVSDEVIFGSPLSKIREMRG